MPDRESPLRTLSFAAAVAVVCALMVAATVQWLRPRQAALQSIEYERVILSAAGLADPAAADLSDREVVSRFLELRTRIVDLQTDQYTDDMDALTYDFRRVAETQARPRYMPVYALERGGRLERIVLPIFGPGMWSTIYGAITLRSDLETVASVVFYDNGETPGIGDRIEDPSWLAQWQGKRVIDSTGSVCFRIRRGANEDCSIDGISGATVTVGSVESIVRDWLGPDGFGPFLATLREADAP